MLDGIISSFIDGRVRVRHSALKKNVHAARAHDALMRTPGVPKTVIHTKTGSLLLEYAPKRLSRTDLLQLAEQLKEILIGEDEEPALGRRKSPVLTPAQIRHLTNRGMIITLGVSVGFALAGRMGVHVALGWGFLALNALHLCRYRRCIKVNRPALFKEKSFTPTETSYRSKTPKGIFSLTPTDGGGLMIRRLDQLDVREHGFLASLPLYGERGQRFRDMGLIPRVEVKVMGHSPMGDLVSLRVMGTTLALQVEDAKDMTIIL